MNNKVFYSPILRLKEGEIVACSKLTRDARPYILPHFVAAPPDDRDPEKRRVLTNEELLIESGLRLARAWGQLPSMLDPRFLTKRLAVEDAANWLPRIFDGAVRAASKPGVVVNFSDAHGPMLAGYANALAIEGTFPAIRLSLADMQLPELEVQVSAILGALGLVPADTVLLLDFGSADIGSVEVAVDVILGAYERLVSYGLWRKVSINITSYPETNPAKSGETVLLPRTEAAIWRSLLDSGSVNRASTLIGDFGPDSSKFVFKSANVAPIPHYRYSTSGGWLVIRGEKGLQNKENILSIANRLVSHELYAGENFSFGDRYYHDSASGKVVGGPKEWRAANVNHHLQFVARQVGADLGHEISSLPPRPEQVDLFEDLSV